MNNKSLSASIAIFTTVGFLTGSLLALNFLTHEMEFEDKGLDEQRTELISHKEHMIGNLIAHGDYTCCLEKPCIYCIEKTPGHGEGATCSCLEDVVNGKHPCGECIGEILEGHGNRFLTKYFAKSIAEEVGEEHLDSLRQIISEKYKVTPSEQL